MTTKDAVAKIGTRAHLRVEKFTVQVEVLDHKNAYGCDRFLVEPVAGAGRVWVDESRLTFASEIAEWIKESQA